MAAMPLCRPFLCGFRVDALPANERALPRVSRGLLAYVGAVERRLLYGSGRRDEMLNIEAMNYFSGQMSADAAGITACLYLYSHLSFHTEGADQERFSRLYHSLRDWACEHDEKEAILAAID